VQIYTRASGAAEGPREAPRHLNQCLFQESLGKNSTQKRPEMQLSRAVCMTKRQFYKCFSLCQKSVEC